MAYISRSMMPTKQWYLQIEKKPLIATQASKRFWDYIIGQYFTIKTDHKPLVTLLQIKNFYDLSL